jgi:hypothetical protein
VNSAPHNISAITDISANIFSLLIFILIMMLAAQERPVVRSEASPVVDVEKDLAGIERSPLGSDELFDLLYDRGKGAASVKIDLFDQGIDVSVDGRTERFNSVESAVLRLRQIAVSTRLPIGIYVFSHQIYRNVTDNLKVFGWSWRELSVPQALRDVSARRAGQSWSAGFSELIARLSNCEQFRIELARLLQSSADGNLNESRYGGGAASGHWRDTIVDNIVQWSRTVLNAIALFGGLIFVTWVEMRRSR